jgi:hypothetical protein
VATTDTGIGRQRISVAAVDWLHALDRRPQAQAMLLSNRPVAGLFLLVLTATGGPGAFGQDSADHIGRHGVGHTQMHDVYKGWHPPGNPKTSCCNNADCRPTRAYVDENGTWRAWNGLFWLVIPPERILPTDLAGDGRSHLCENAGYIYCFTPGPPRS